jgi:plasmid stabilization system protein ParE
MDITEENELEIKPTTIAKRCEKQLDQAIEYMEQRSEKQAAIMRNQFFKITRILERMPGLGTKYKKGMRKIQLGKFRYFIYYRVKEKEIEIVGIWHTSRGMDFEEPLATSH